MFVKFVSLRVMIFLKSPSISEIFAVSGNSNVLEMLWLIGIDGM